MDGGGYSNDGYVGGPGDPGYNNNFNKGGGEVDGAEVVVVRRANLSDSQLKKEKFRIMKNVVLISFSFLFLFTAFQSMANLQSSINKVGKMHVDGTARP